MIIYRAFTVYKAICSEFYKYYLLIPLSPHLPQKRGGWQKEGEVRKNRKEKGGKKKLRGFYSL